MFVDRSDQNTPNKYMVMTRAFVDAKKINSRPVKQKDILENFTIDSPAPFDINAVLSGLKDLDEQMVEGAKARTEQ